MPFVPAMTITLNAMPKHGARITDTIQLLVLCLLTLMKNVLMIILFIKNVKKIRAEPAVRPVMSTPVLPDAFMPIPTVVRGILLTVNAAPQLPLPDVRPTMALTVQVQLPVPMIAVIPVINAATIPVRPGLLKTTPELILRRLNAVHLVIVVKTVLPEALLIPVLTSALLNAGLAMLVMIPVKQVLLPLTVRQHKIKSAFLLPNAEPLVILAKTIPIVRSRINPAFTDVLLTIPAVSVPPAEVTRIVM